MRNLSLSNARQLLENEGFTNISVLEQETSDHTPGSVISQSPTSGSSTYSLDTRVTLVVAKSPAAVTDANDPDAQNQYDNGNE